MTDEMKAIPLPLTGAAGMQLSCTATSRLLEMMCPAIGLRK